MATVESIAIVTAEEPLYDVPDKPVPIVKAFDAVAVTVTEPPKLTEEPLIVMALLSSEAFGIADSVFVAPEIDLPVKVVGMSALTSKRKDVGAEPPEVGPA